MMVISLNDAAIAPSFGEMTIVRRGSGVVRGARAVRD